MGLIQWERFGVRFTADGILDVKATATRTLARAPGGAWQPRDWRGRWIWMGERVQLRGRNRYGTVVGADERRGVTIDWDDGHTSTIAPHLLRVDTPVRPRTPRGRRAPHGDALFELSPPPATTSPAAVRSPAARARISAGAWAPAPDGTAPDRAAIRYLASGNTRAWLTETNGRPVAYLDQDGNVRRYADIAQWEADVNRLGLAETDPPRGPADGVPDPDARPVSDAITHVTSPDGVVHAWMVRTTGGVVGYVRGRDGQTRRFAGAGRWRLAAQSEGVSVTARRSTPRRRPAASPAFKQTPIPDLFGPAPVDAADKPDVAPTPDLLPEPEPAAPSINVADLVPGLPGYDEDEAIGQLRKLIDGASFGGLTLRFVRANVTDGRDGSGKISWRADMYDARGRRVGSTDRVWHRETDGTLWAHNDFMSLRRDARGNGFAAPYSLWLERHYWKAGFTHVSVDAGLDDGGYVWASAGFDFADEWDAARRLEKLQELVAAGDGTRDELTAAQVLLARASQHAFGEPGFPSAREISQVGRTPGQNWREQSWIGSRAMRGSAWNGIKRNPVLATSHSTAAKDSGEPERATTPAPSTPAPSAPARRSDRPLAVANGNATASTPAAASTPARTAATLRRGDRLRSARGPQEITDVEHIDLPFTQEVVVTTADGQGHLYHPDADVTADVAPKPPPAADDLATLIPETATFDAAHIRERLRTLVEGHRFGPYTVEVVGAKPTFNADDGTGTLWWRADILDSDGRTVGHAIRSWRRHPDGTVTEHNDALHLDRDARGSGFASAWGAHLERAYWASGFDHSTVHAAMDDGGYVWASAGYNFDNATDAEGILGKLRLLVASDTPPLDAATRAAANKILERATLHTFGQPGYPSAREISQLGRRPGQRLREHVWLGSAVMRGSAWHGIKHNPDRPHRITPVDRSPYRARDLQPGQQLTVSGNVNTIAAVAPSTTRPGMIDVTFTNDRTVQFYPEFDLGSMLTRRTTSAAATPTPAPTRRPRRQGPPITTLRPGQRIRNGRYGPIADIAEVRPNGRGATVVFTDGSTRVLRGPNIPISFVVPDDTPAAAPPPTPPRRPAAAAAADPGIPDPDARPEQATLYYSSPDGPGEAWMSNDGRIATFHVRGRDGIVRRYTNTIAWAAARDAAGATETMPAPTPAAHSTSHLPDPPPGWLASDVIPSHGNYDPDVIKQQMDALVADRSFNGFTVKVTDVHADYWRSSGSLTFSADIFDANGQRVGRTQRRWKRESDGTMWAYNALLALDEHARGGGFAPAWGAYLEQLYWESGFDHIEVTASLEDGGYVWASAGFDFKSPFDARDMLNRLRRLLEENNPPIPAAARSAAEALQARAERHRFGEPGYPSARELSQLGRQPGQNIREHSWLGMLLMRGRTWGGIKRRPERADV
ncbi:hypothetical protein ETD86_12825 [Nonomuraea turkmeniaca]|uniref:Uncharacterized protein n=1 Tax=Nonomuraea turkmeniaca TaxID=103838 RepID=A0A5S4G7X2_9ACTN|nr:hypothetical protein [Nonomuraea turkmeniaca]TMR22050.1 hypothetical protein ETD86_12825 [Nonomuraea turkmeniaca]